MGTLTQNEHHQKGWNQIEEDAVAGNGSCLKTPPGEFRIKKSPVPRLGLKSGKGFHRFNY
jgi:hypothetical protein